MNLIAWETMATSLSDDSKSRPIRNVRSFTSRVHWNITIKLQILLIVMMTKVARQRTMLSHPVILHLFMINLATAMHWLTSIFENPSAISVRYVKCARTVSLFSVSDICDVVTAYFETSARLTFALVCITIYFLAFDDFTSYQERQLKVSIWGQPLSKDRGSRFLSNHAVLHENRITVLLLYSVPASLLLADRRASWRYLVLPLNWYLLQVKRF